MELTNINVDQLQLIKNTIAKDADDNELGLFLHACKQTKLDPLTRQIYAIKRWDSRLGKNVMQVQVSIDGARLIAQRSHRYAGQTQPMWCGADGVWKDVWLDSNPPSAAKVGVHHKDFKEPLYAIALWSDYCPVFNNGKISPMWQKMGSLMLCKCAEMLALRKAFPAELSGLYSNEEMQQAEKKPIEEQVKQIKSIDEDFPRKEEDTEKGPDYLYVKGKYRGVRNKDVDVTEMEEYFNKYLLPKYEEAGSFKDGLWQETFLMMRDWIDNYSTYQDILAELNDE